MCIRDRTYTCLEEIKKTLASEGEEGPALILLVPEQAAFQMEHELYTCLLYTSRCV